MKRIAVRDVWSRLMTEVYRNISHFYQITRHRITADSIKVMKYSVRQILVGQFDIV